MNITGYLGIGDSRRIIEPGQQQDLPDRRQRQLDSRQPCVQIRRRHPPSARRCDYEQLAVLADDVFGDCQGNAAADFMLGYPRTTLTPEGVPISAIRQWRYAVYAQDDWKVTRSLTLNLGLRYDFYGQPREINGVTRTLRFDLDPDQARAMAGTGRGR